MNEKHVLRTVGSARITESCMDVTELKKEVTILMVTHNLHQAARVSDRTAFMYLGELIEYEKSEEIFTNPKDIRTENYITGRFG